MCTILDFSSTVHAVAVQFGNDTQLEEDDTLEVHSATDDGLALAET